MTITNKTKTIFRWTGIGAVSLCYFITLLASTFTFGALHEQESMRFSGPLSLNEYHASIDSIMQATDGVFNVALFGFAICLSLKS